MEQDEAELLAALEKQPLEIARMWTLFACEEALVIWNDATLDFEYRDSVVGLKHRIDPALPRRTIEAILGGGATHAIEKEWLEPITALQDDDWSIEGPAELVFYACYNALLGATGKKKLLAKSIIQARNALRIAVEDRFPGVWENWWTRCNAYAPPLDVPPPQEAPKRIAVSKVSR